MKRKIKYYHLIWLKYDLPAGLSVFLVALPLCLGIALASGAPVYSGLISGIIGGLIVSLISGSSLSVSGPAAGLTTVVGSLIISLGDFRLFLLAVIVAGIFQIVLGILRFGSIANYFPSSVIKGMLAAIGILLVSKQIPLAIGYDKPDFWSSGFLKLFKSDNLFSNLTELNMHITRTAIIISLVSILAYYFLKKFNWRITKLIPIPLFVVIIGIIISMVSSTSVFSLKETQLVNVPGNILSDISFPDFTTDLFNPKILRGGLLIGLLATLETLLCIEAVDKLDRHNRITPVNRELIAQGIGNITCGLLGAIPITAVVVRGAANVDAGARTKLSSFTHGGFLFLSVLFIPGIISMIPLASLSAILIVTGYNLSKPKLFKNMWSLGWKQFLPFIFTIIVILTTDLLIGVSIGLLISIYFIIQNNFHAEYKITRRVFDDSEEYLIKLNSNVTFLNKVKLRKALDQIPEESILTIDGSECNFIDYDILEIISEFESKAADRNIQVRLKEIEKVSVSAVH